MRPDAAKLLLSITGVLLFIFTLTGCFKDKMETTRRFAIYTPEYKTVSEVREKLMIVAPKEIQYPGKIYIKGNYIFLGEINRGIHIIDNSNPASPQNIGYIEIPYNVDMAVKNNTLYADMGGDLLTIDITDPKNARVKKITEKAFPTQQRWAKADDKVIVNWNRRDTVIYTKADAKPKGDEHWYPIAEDGTFYNLSSGPPGSTGATGGVYGTGGSMARFATTKERLFAVGNNNLGVFNISEDLNPQLVVTKPLGWGIETIFPFGENLFIGTNTGVLVFSLENADNPSQVGAFGHVRSCDPVVTDGKHIFVTLRAGSNCGQGVSQLQILSATSLTNLNLVKSYNLENPYGLAVDGNILLICDGTAGLKVYDMADVNAIKLLQTLKDIKPYDVIAVNGRAIVSAADGIYQYDYKTPSSLKRLSALKLKK